MTQQETKQFIFELTKTLVAKNCYIKGHGPNLWRVVDEKHNPLQNISETLMNILKFNKIVKRTDMCYRLDVSASPFIIALDVKLPTNE